MIDSADVVPPVTEPDFSPSFSTTSRAPHYLFLDGLRGAAALYVVLYHFFAWYSEGLPSLLTRLLLPFSFGHFAVIVFIVLSGFSLMLPIARNGGLRGGLGLYFTRRAQRILPPYYAALFLSMGMVLGMQAFLPKSPFVSTLAPANLGDVLAHLFLVHNVIPRWNHSYNMALWSVATEWQLYFLLPFLFVPVWKKWGVGAMVATGVLVGLVPGLVAPAQLSEAYFGFAGLFALGMAGAVLVQRPENKQKLALRRGLYLTGVVAFLLVTAVLRSVTGGGAACIAGENTVVSGSVYAVQDAKDTAVGLLVLCFILWAVSFVPTGEAEKETHLPLAIRFLESRPLRNLAAFSYSLYLTHCIVLKVLQVFFGLWSLSPLAFWMWKAGVGVPVALIFAYGFYRCFEKPFLRRRGQSMQAADGAVLDVPVGATTAASAAVVLAEHNLVLK